MLDAAEPFDSPLSVLRLFRRRISHYAPATTRKGRPAPATGPGAPLEGLSGLSFACDESVVRPRADSAKNATMKGFQAGILLLPFLDPKSGPLPAYTLRVDAQDERTVYLFRPWRRCRSTERRLADEY